MFFASDNNSPVPPQVFEAMQRANEGYAPAYGNDPLTESVAARIRDIFEAPEAAVYLVATGTAANALALACFCPPWGAVYCHRDSHIEEDECGAPEFYTGGAKLVLLDGEHGRITPETLEARLAAAQHVGVHNVQRGMLSLTNTTEAGTVYSPADVAALTAVARRYGIPCHLDGARFANALVAAGCTPAELTWKAGIDVLSFGGTKNGLMGVEAVVIFDPARAWEFELRRKRGGHLFSKHRYLAAQMEAYLEGDLWLTLAGRANAAAARLAEGLGHVPGLRLEHPVEANMLFASFPRGAHRRAREAGASYYMTTPNATLDGPDDQQIGARLVCSWSTTEADIERFVGLLRG
ncbi:threonine aldolase family protein [Alkalilacustris brevis]|uniref:threonine aldolase family protein n=1 Tax=Alkalilacustris brevis TaxID=2026338 RepID=UPI000E0D1CDB|nr:low specificity L-threonine aldolase [Alkalilacustris brevis]